MKSRLVTPLTLRTRIDRWNLVAPFRITGFEFDTVDVLVVALGKDGCTGWGEAAGVYYTKDKPLAMLDQVEALRATIERGISRDILLDMFPAGGARNALDCALWDLEAKLTEMPVWQLAGLRRPNPMVTTFTCGADEPDTMAAAARAFTDAKAIKIKLTGESLDVARVHAVRRARPDVWLCVDANQGLTRPALEDLLPVLVEANVGVIEQPLPVGHEADLEGLHSPIPIVADESVHVAADIPALVGRFTGVNIKLDKCGGLTAGLAMVRAAREFGLLTMIGNMIASSLAFAPAVLLGQLCDVVDLDGPAFLAEDRAPKVEYAAGKVVCPVDLWGNTLTLAHG